LFIFLLLLFFVITAFKTNPNNVTNFSKLFQLHCSCVAFYFLDAARKQIHKKVDKADRQRRNDFLIQKEIEKQHNIELNELNDAKKDRDKIENELKELQLKVMTENEMEDQLRTLIIQKLKCSKLCTILVVIIVKIISLCSFLFYCLLCNHSFQTNPNNVTNLSKLFNYIAPASLF